MQEMWELFTVKYENFGTGNLLNFIAVKSC